ncbi:hypothetical protein MMC28_006850 [Mycoblastus sanguinarius]|nr:hypothetical protein [Mycoblastus sanguinarius]
MMPQILALFALLATGFTTSLPLEPSNIVQAPSQKSVTILLPPSSNTTTTTTAPLGKWPDPPFYRHLAWDTDVEVVSCMPSDRAPQSSILGDIRLLGARARSEGSRLSMIQDWHAVSGSVEFGFHATEELLLFSGSDVAMVLEVLAEMVNIYGAAGISGSLVKVDVEIAYFELALKIASSTT